MEFKVTFQLKIQAKFTIFRKIVCIFMDYYVKINTSNKQLDVCLKVKGERDEKENL